ncbi:U3 small nucleolar RNA-associated protein NOL7 isoform 1-T1 [Rhinophrynus dorsalis]
MGPQHEHQSEDDEAPEEVTFQSAKSRAEENTKREQQAARREKAILKEKRKLREELFKEQKKRKLLSEDILQTITALPEKTDLSKDQDTSQEKGNAVKKPRVRKRGAQKKLRPKIRLQDSYSAVRLEDYSLMNLQQQKAKSFIQNKLYGQSKNRTTANEFLSISSKKGVVKRPAVQFTDKTWGKKEKKKAERFNLMWRDRQKL